MVENVRLYFLHHAGIFPSPYPDFYGVDAVRSVISGSSSRPAP